MEPAKERAREQDGSSIEKEAVANERAEISHGPVHLHPIWSEKLRLRCGREAHSGKD